jgi:apolipoprotein D and lipocalin family protein
VKWNWIASPRIVFCFVVLSLAGCTGIPSGIEPVQSFDARRYTGEWYEIARLDHRFERGLTHVRAVYTLKPDGTVSVENKGFNPKKCQWSDIEGSAHFLQKPDVASLSVTFFPPFAGGYHVFALDRKNYQWAMVAGPTKDYLWILSRKPSLDSKILERLINEARAKGFPVDQLIMVNQGQLNCSS